MERIIPSLSVENCFTSSPPFPSVSLLFDFLNGIMLELVMGNCKVEKFEVEKKSFQVKFEGSNGGTWVSVKERSRGFVVSVGFGREEVVWLTEHLKKAVELENTRGFRVNPLVFI